MKLIYELEDGAKAPTKAHLNDAGFDLFFFKRLSDGRIDTGLRVLIPCGYVGLVLPRSSMSKRGYITATGVIDADYTGTIKVDIKPSCELRGQLKNPSCAYVWETSEDGKSIELKQRQLITPIQVGDRIAQLVVVPLPQVELVEGKVSDVQTERGQNGFGSSGR